MPTRVHDLVEDIKTQFDSQTVNTRNMIIYLGNYLLPHLFSSF